MQDPVPSDSSRPDALSPETPVPDPAVPETPDVAPDDVAVLVPAAGRGTRLGGKRKQFRTLGEAPLLVQTLRVFERSPSVGHVVVAVPKARVTRVTDRLRQAGLTKVTAVVSGGDSRQASVRHALRAVPNHVSIVLVHDAVRPFVTAESVGEVVRAVCTHGAASLAIPVADTLRKASPSADDDRGDEDDGDSGDENGPPVRILGTTVPRDGLMRMQTPQGFRRDWLESAHAAARARETTATDDVALVQEDGHDVVAVTGSPLNVKITTPADWEFAQTIWPTWSEK